MRSLFRGLINGPLRSVVLSKPDVELMVTLLPSFLHFSKFAYDSRLSGIRLNSAMLTNFDLDKELAQIPKDVQVPLYFDIKGRQLRVTKLHPERNILDFELNHPIRVDLPTPILFKGGEDSALLIRLHDGERWYAPEDGHLPKDKLFYRLEVTHGPYYSVRSGESLHIRDASLVVGGNQFVETEIKKIEQVKKSGLTRWFLSYVQSQHDVDEFLELVGRDAQVVLKIESKKGLEYVAREFKKRDNLRLCAAKGDLFVEVDKPDDILKAQKLIVATDPQAIAGSRMLLSVLKKVPYIFERPDGSKVIKYKIETNEVPSDADFEQLAWLYEIGYRSFMLCDDLCLHGELLSVATNALHAFKESYCK
jgi:Pyruvate kinase, barrel domain